MFRFSDYGIESDIVILAMIAVFTVLLILLIVAFVKIGKMKKKYVAFMEGEDGKSLEETFHKKFENMDLINEELKKIQNHLELVDENLFQTYQKVSIVKYDAFKEIGGTLSFVLVMLTKDNDGFILNSMHSNSEGCYTYIKEVKSGEVFVALSEEERQALEEAKES